MINEIPNSNPIFVCIRFSDRRYADAWPPPSASSSALAEGAAVYSEEGVDYEEKYLSPIFREFLSQRKSSFSTQ